MVDSSKTIFREDKWATALAVDPKECSNRWVTPLITIENWRRARWISESEDPIRITMSSRWRKTQVQKETDQLWIIWCHITRAKRIQKRTKERALRLMVIPTISTTWPWADNKIIIKAIWWGMVVESRYLKVEHCWLVRVDDQRQAQGSMATMQIKTRQSSIQITKTTILDWVIIAQMLTMVQNKVQTKDITLEWIWFRRTPALCEDRRWILDIPRIRGLHRHRITTHQIRNMLRSWSEIIKIRILEALNWGEALIITTIATPEETTNRIPAKGSPDLARARFLGHRVEVWISCQNIVHKTNLCNNNSIWWNSNSKLKPKRSAEREISLRL